MRVSVLLALVGAAIAAVDPNDPCGRDGETVTDFKLTIASLEDAKLVATCKKLTVALEVDMSYPGDLTLPILESMEELYAGHNGSAETSDLTGLSFPALVYASDIVIRGVGDLATINVPVLETVNGPLTLQNLPSLKDWNGFETLTFVSYTNIVNTGLRSIVWNSTDSRNAHTGEIYISNNTNADIINLQNVRKVDFFEIHGNGNTQIALGLETVRQLTISGCAGWKTGYGFDGPINLENVTGLYGADGKIEIYDNTFEELGFDYLEWVNGQFLVHDNPNLVNLSAWQLGRVEEDFDITNNAALKAIKETDFRWLDDIGRVNLTGLFETIDLSRTLNVTYGFEIRTTANYSCRRWDADWERGLIAADSIYSCLGNYNGSAEVEYKLPEDRDGAGGGSSGSKKKGGLSRAAFWAIVIAIPVPFGLAFWGTVIWCLCRRHKRKKAAAAAKTDGQMTTVAAPYQGGPPPVTYYGAPPTTTTPQPYNTQAFPATTSPQPYQNTPYAAYADPSTQRKALAVYSTNDQASSLTVGERDRDREGMLSTHSSVSRESRTGEMGLEQREEELRERERVIEELERERRAEELNARERVLAEREREIRAWDEQRRSGLGLS